MAQGGTMGGREVALPTGDSESFEGGTETVPWETPQAERTRSQIHPSVFLQLLLYLLFINSLGQASSQCQALAAEPFH